MDSNHRLDAPNNDELNTIEQFADRSELASIYREPGKQFEGELLSAEARTKAKAEELEAITSGIGKSVLSIGLYVPYPFVCGALLATGLFLVTGQVNQMVLVPLVIISGAFWAITSYRAYSSIFKKFYKHALRAGPFLVVMLISLILGSQAIYDLVVNNFAEQNLLFSVALISLLSVVYSFVASYILLGIWGNSKLNSGIKALVSFLIIMVSFFFVVATYLF